MRHLAASGHAIEEPFGVVELRMDRERIFGVIAHGFGPKSRGMISTVGWVAAWVSPDCVRALWGVAIKHG
jgi:hypothetical protein